MKKLLRIATALLLSITLLTGCSEIFPSDGRFYVKDIDHLEKGVAKYYLVAVKGRGSFFIKDRPGLYDISDTLHITK